MDKIYYLIGTEAEFIKLFPIMKEMEKRGQEYKIIATGQNDIEKSSLFKFLNREEADFKLKTAHNKNAFSFLCWLIKTFFGLISIFKKIKNDRGYLIVHGDTCSTLLGGIVGKIYKFKICHVEAGLRSFKLTSPFPEEINRRIVSKLADINFCQDEVAVKNLEKEKGIKINTEYNTLIDSLNFVLDLPKKDLEIYKKLENQKYCVFVYHRQENVYNKQKIKDIVDLIIETSEKIKCVFLLHKITKIELEKNGLLEKLQNNKNIILQERMNYEDFMQLFSDAEFVITDGGSNQEELYYLGKPAVILRKYTERKEGLGKNILLCDHDFDKIRQFINNYQNYKKDIVESENPSKIIVDYLKND